MLKDIRFKKVITEIPAEHYPHQYPEVTKEEKERVCIYKRGQRVKVTDGSYNFDATTGIARPGIHELFRNQSAAIIETGCQRFVSGVLDWINQTDLLLLFEDGTEVYCASNCVQLLTHY